MKLETPNAIQNLIEQFNHRLETTPQLQQYHLQPFLENHPLHITLYLTDYREENLPAIKKTIARLAKNIKPFLIQSDSIHLQNSAFVMLSLQNSPLLQQLSNKTVLSLYHLRDKHTAIPQWVKNNPDKQRAFTHYGSPNTFDEFSPHLSLLAPINPTPRLTALLSQFIDEFKRERSLKYQAKTVSIGLGIADNQGQITQELASFTLGNVN